MTLPSMVPHDQTTLKKWCREIDGGPWASVAVPERTTYPSHDLVVQLSAAAVLTERVRLWTTIVVLPAHSAVDMAKKMASVDRLSDGRLSMGLGVGGREDDYKALGAPFTRRWSRMDEQVGQMLNIWKGGVPFEGADPVGPPPVQLGGPPLFGSSMGPKSLARAAKWAEGINGAWTINGDAEGVAAGVETVRQAWRDAGRDGEPHVSTNVWFCLGDGAQETLSNYVHSYMRIFSDDLGRSMGESSRCHTVEALVCLLYTSPSPRDRG